MVKGSDVAAFLVQAKVCKAAPSGLDGFAALALDALEQQTGYSPFFAADSDSERRFDPPGDGNLNLKSGLVSLTSVTIGVTSTNDGSELIQNDGYAVWPDNAFDCGKAVTRIDFFFAVGGSPRSVVVNGRWGRMDKTHRSFEAAKQAVVMKAAALAIEWALGQPGEQQSIRQGPVSIEFDRSEGNSRKGGWTKAFDDFCGQWRRSTL